MTKEVIETEELIVEDFSRLAQYCKFKHRARCRNMRVPIKCDYYLCPLLGWKSDQRVKITIETIKEATAQ